MSSVSNQASAHRFCQESVLSVCSSAFLRLTNQEIKKSRIFLRSWKKKGKEEKSTGQNLIKQNLTARQRELEKEFQKVSSHLCFLVSSGKLYEPEVKKHPSINVSPKPTVFFMETWALRFWMATQQELNKQIQTSTGYSHPLQTNQRTEQACCISLPMICRHVHKTGSYSLQHSLKNRSGDSLKRSQESSQQWESLVDLARPSPSPNHACYMHTMLALHASHRSCELKFECSI